MGVLPTHVSTLEEQVARACTNFKSFRTDLEKHVFLRALQDRSEVLFYALIDRHIEEMMPIIYTPTVAQAVEQFSRIYRYPQPYRLEFAHEPSRAAGWKLQGGIPSLLETVKAVWPAWRLHRGGGASGDEQHALPGGVRAL